MSPQANEIFIDPDKGAFLPVLDKMMRGGLVTLEKVQVLQYGHESIREPTRLT